MHLQPQQVLQPKVLLLAPAGTSYLFYIINKLPIFIIISDSVGSSKFRKIPSDPKSPSLFRVGSKSKTPMLEKEFSISSMPSIDPSVSSF